VDQHPCLEAYCKCGNVLLLLVLLLLLLLVLVLLLLLLLLLQGITYVESTGNFLAIEEVRYSEQHDELHPFTHELRISDNGTQYETVQVRAAVKVDVCEHCGIIGKVAAHTVCLGVWCAVAGAVRSTISCTPSLTSCAYLKSAHSTKLCR
jgi:hypothetical protein